MEAKLRTISLPGSPKRIFRVTAPSNCLAGVVKQVLSGDTIVLHGFKGTPPTEKELTLYGINAPKLGRRPSATQPNESQTRDEPWAWEARDFLRKILIGQKVFFTFVKGHRFEFGYVWLGENRETAENIVEIMLREGYATVKRDLRQSTEIKFLLDLEAEAKAAGRGRWSHAQPLRRKITWCNDNCAQLVKHYGGKPVKALIEFVRDGSTLRLFLLPEFRYITMIISGIRCPEVVYEGDKDEDKEKRNQPYGQEAKFFVEQRLLNRDVEVILETNVNNTFVGSVLHPRGNIAEALLREGLAKCVDWSLCVMGASAHTLRLAENTAKEKRLRLWQNYVPKVQPPGEFFGHVVEIFVGDSINVKLSHGELKRVYFASIRVPREINILQSADQSDDKNKRPNSSRRSQNNYRPLYDTPYLFETREFLRRKLIGKRVHCLLSYVLPQSDSMSEKCFYNVLLNRENVAEALVAEGLATCLNYSADGKKPLFFDQLQLAETEAIQKMKGIHSKCIEKLPPVVDLTVEPKRIRTQFLPAWQRADRIDAIVEFLSGGSRFRLFLPKFRCLVTFLLSGITCPRASRQAQGKIEAQRGDPFGDEALEFARHTIFQRDVTVQILKLNKQCNAVMGWLWVDNKTNLSVALVQEGFAEIHVSAQTSEHYRPLKNAEKHAKIAKKNIWSLQEDGPQEDPLEYTIASDQLHGVRVVNLENVLITEVTKRMSFFAQNVSDMSKLEVMSKQLQNDLNSNATELLKTMPKIGNLYACRFSLDKCWYRARVEYLKAKGDIAGVLYIDYGNREEIKVENLVELPQQYLQRVGFAREYALALIELPLEAEDREEALRVFAGEVINKIALMNIELLPNDGTLPLVTLYTLNGCKNISREMIGSGLVLVDQRTEPKLQLLLQQYTRLEETAFYARLGIWKYGDSTADN